MQELELELKHISKEDPNAEGIARSLSRRQERLRRSGTNPSMQKHRETYPSQAYQQGRPHYQDNMPTIPSLVDNAPMGQAHGTPGPEVPPHTTAPHSRLGFLNPHNHFFGRRGHGGHSAGPAPAQSSRNGFDFTHYTVRLTLEDKVFDRLQLEDEWPTDSHDPRTYSPSLSVKCGPLLRYSGLRRDGSGQADANSKQEIWRGSIMVVTTDKKSTYSPAPFVRLFYLDTNSGGDSANANGDTSRQGSHSIIQEGEKMSKFKEVEALQLHAERGVTFWRFSLEIELGDSQSKVGYRINRGPLLSFWVPARGQTMNIMFHSCNGFSLNTNPDDFCGPDPLWRDVLNEHKKKPFHVMIGGGDQIYNDAVSKQTKYFQTWLSIKTPFQKSAHEFTAEMSEELEEFYLERYSMWFSQGLFGVANSQIPMVNIWDDHDIIDGFGSYPSHFNRCPVFTGLGAIAFKFYMLFQHQSLVHEKEEHEPSWVIGKQPGPYIVERSRSIFMFLGRSIALLGVDCRTERMRDQVLYPQTYEKILSRVRLELVPGEMKHLIVLLGVPIAYPRLVWLENLLTSRIMDPIKILGRIGIFGGFINNFDGGVELLDDLDDHWTAKNHKAERKRFILMLQRLAAEHSVRVTILGGDVHLAGIGQFMSNPKLKVAKQNDFRYMPNIISSAIVNAPPPNTMADILNKRNKVHHLDDRTDEDMFPIFQTDVDGTPRNNKRLLPRRNYCTIYPYNPDEADVGINLKPKKTSTLSKIRRSTFGRKQSDINKPADFVMEGGLDGAGGSRIALDPHELMKDGIQATLRVQIDQRDPSGATRPYTFAIPALTCDSNAI